MRKAPQTAAELESLMDLLAHKDGLVRQKARRSLVAMGRPSVEPLTLALNGSMSVDVRWEAAKALGAIDDAASIPPLVDALEDDDFDVAWVAADALHKFGRAAWSPLLHKLIRDDWDYAVYHQRFHHVFLNQSDEGFNDLLSTLLKALDSGEVRVAAELAARKILERMKAKY